MRPLGLLTSCTQQKTDKSSLSLQKERVLENGLVDGHAYTLTGIRKVGGARPLCLPSPSPLFPGGLLAKAFLHHGEC